MASVDAPDSKTSHFQALIIGSGQAGTPLATAFATAGQKTALIDRAHIAGCCVNEGCTPTKTLIASGRAAYLTRRGQDYGIHTNSATSGSKDGKNEVIVDMQRVRERKREIVDSFRGGSEKRVANAGVTVLMGSASFVDAKTVKVTMNDDGNEKLVTADKIFINVGERPAPPSLPGVENLDPSIVLDSTSIQELDVVPDHLVVIGGGYVGVEFAQYMCRLGAKVSIVQRGKQLLPREDEDVAGTLLDILTQDGITTHLSSSTASIAPSPTTSGFTLTLKTPTGAVEVQGSHILFAAGRIPNTDSLNLAAASISVNSKGYIVTNPFLETSATDIYALGDVKGPPAFTHISYDDFRILKSNLLLPPSPDKPLLTTKTREDIVPYVVYTDPQLAHIGLHEAEARAKFPDKQIKVAKMPMSYVARALETDESRGVMKAVVEGDEGRILGFTCLGMEGGEVMAVVQMAMLAGARYEVLQEAVWAHPSLAESLNNLWGFLE
ncbi:mercuric reductase [Cadophora sp. MPI-SDFR-AT-0126]|nr:mercuric reductase [Leotiomycetes sp. MPI-SDFR-AT-0126]